MWGNSDKSCSGGFICPVFNRVPDDGRNIAYGPGATSAKTAPVLATTVVYFTMVGGKIYVMGY